jgi:Helicase conserved C-terminal domain
LLRGEKLLKEHEEQWVKEVYSASWIVILKFGVIVHGIPVKAIDLDDRKGFEDKIVEENTDTLNINNTTGKKTICFVRRKALGEELVDHLGCHFYHANMSDRDTVLTAWHRGTGFPMVVATSALSAGVDYASVRLILHLDTPPG